MTFDERVVLHLADGARLGERRSNYPLILDLVLSLVDRAECRTSPPRVIISTVFGVRGRKWARSGPGPHTLKGCEAHNLSDITCLAPPLAGWGWTHAPASHAASHVTSGDHVTFGVLRTKSLSKVTQIHSYEGLSDFTQYVTRLSPSKFGAA